MSKIKRSLLTIFTLLLMIVGASMPTNAKRVHHHRIKITRKAHVNHRRYRHRVYKYRHHRRYYYKHHKRRYRYKRYKKYHHYKKKKKMYRKKRGKRKRYRKPKPKSVDLPSVAQFSKRDFNDINQDRRDNNLPQLNNDKSLQKIANDRVLLAYKAWQNNWNSHGSDGKTETAAQLAFDANGKDYNSNIILISENNALSHRSDIPATSSMVDGKINYFPPDDVSTPAKIVDTNNDIYMNHDVGADGQSGHRANILGAGVNSVGTAIYQKNGCYVQDEVFGYVM